MSDHTDRRRNGIEFDHLSEELSAVEFPVTTADLLDAHGDHELRVADGTRTVRETLYPLVAARAEAADAPAPALSFESPDDVLQALVGMVDDGAIGRKAYSDRTPPVPGERTQGRDESI